MNRHARLLVLALVLPCAVSAQQPQSDQAPLNTTVSRADSSTSSIAAPRPTSSLAANPAGVTPLRDRTHAREQSPYRTLTQVAAGVGSELETVRRSLLSVNDAPPSTARAPWTAPVASLLLPGAGQGLLRQQRALGYVVAEAFLVLRATRANRDFTTARDRYRELASDVARASFGSPRPVGPWEYYEALEKYQSSGVYDAAIGGQFTPETDTLTFNGQQWYIARSQFWVDPDVAPPTSSPEYQRALALYRQKAVQGSFQWTWRDNQLYRTDFLNSIKEANDSNQRYVNAIGMVVANHLVSLIDAYVNVRLRRYGGAGLSTASLSTEIRPVGNPGNLDYGMRLNVTIPVRGPR